MLQHHVIAEMPLAEVSAVVVITNQLGNSGRVCRQRYVVAMQPHGVRIQASHDACTARSANRLRYVSVLKHEPVIGDPVEVRRLDPIVPVARQRVLTLLIGQDEEDVRPACSVGHVARSM